LSVAPYKIQFALQGISRTFNANWSIDGFPGASDRFKLPGGLQEQYKKVLRRGDYKTLNVYFQENMYDGSYAYAQFPVPGPVSKFNFTESV
jgi:hypothetical protein